MKPCVLSLLNEPCLLPKAVAKSPQSSLLAEHLVNWQLSITFSQQIITSLVVIVVVAFLITCVIKTNCKQFFVHVVRKK